MYINKEVGGRNRRDENVLASTDERQKCLYRKDVRARKSA